MTKKAVGNAGKVYKKYTEEFRRDAVRMIESEGLTTAEAGRRLGVNANLLRKWRQTYGKKSETQAAQSDLEAENRRLRDEVRLDRIRKKLATLGRDLKHFKERLDAEHSPIVWKRMERVDHEAFRQKIAHQVT